MLVGLDQNADQGSDWVGELPGQRILCLICEGLLLEVPAAETFMRDVRGIEAIVSVRNRDLIDELLPGSCDPRNDTDCTAD